MFALFCLWEIHNDDDDGSALNGKRCWDVEEEREYPGFGRVLETNKLRVSWIRWGDLWFWVEGWSGVFGIGSTTTGKGLWHPLGPSLKGASTNLTFFNLPSSSAIHESKLSMLDFFGGSTMKSDFLKPLTFISSCNSWNDHNFFNTMAASWLARIPKLVGERTMFVSCFIPPVMNTFLAKATFKPMHSKMVADRKFWMSAE